jgi:hypothetical protein
MDKFGAFFAKVSIDSSEIFKELTKETRDKYCPLIIGFLKIR